MVDFIHCKDHGDPGEDDQRDIDHTADGAESLAAGEFVLKNVLVEGLCQKDQRQREGEVDASLGDVVIQPVETCKDVE